MKKLVSKYLKHPLIASIEFDAQQKAYTIMERGCRSKRRGLVSSLQAKYYPDYERSVRTSRASRTRRAAQGSSKMQGITVDKQLAAYIMDGNKPPKNALARALVTYWAEHNFQLIAAQVPTYVRRFDCVTQCDVLAYNASDQSLWMFEVKTGYPTGGFRKKGTLSGIVDVPSTIYNHWQLQRHYTHIGFLDYGLNVAESRVIQVFKRKKEIIVKVHENPQWCEDL